MTTDPSITKRRRSIPAAPRAPGASHRVHGRTLLLEAVAPRRRERHPPWFFPPPRQCRRHEAVGADQRVVAGDATTGRAEQIHAVTPQTTRFPENGSG